MLNSKKPLLLTKGSHGGVHDNDDNIAITFPASIPGILLQTEQELEGHKSDSESLDSDSPLDIQEVISFSKADSGSKVKFE